MRVASTLLSLVVFFGCTTTAAAGPRAASTRSVSVDGSTVLAEDVAWDLVNEAGRATDVARKKAAYRRVVDEFADTTARGPAAVALARLLLDEKTPAATKEAQTNLERLLREEPMSPAADDAQVLLSMTQHSQQSGVDPVKALVEKLPENERGAGLLKVGREMISHGQAKDGVRALFAALPRLTGADRKAAEDDLVFALDMPMASGGLSFADVKGLKAEAATDPFVDEVVTWKLARIAGHQKDDVAAQSLAQDLVKKFPKSRFAKDAAALVARLETRVQTNPMAVGVVLPLTGEYAAYGKRALTAVRLAFNLTVSEEPTLEPVLDEATGEMVQPKREPEKLAGTLVTPSGLKLIVKDSAGRVDRAQAAVRDLVEQDHVIAILGDILIDTSLPIALAAEDYAVPMVSLSRREGVPEAGPWSFRLALTPKKQARALAEYAVDGLKMKRFAIMYPKHAFGTELMNEFWDALDARQAEVTAIESYNHDQTSFATETKSLVARGQGGGNTAVTECRDNARDITNEYRRKKALEGCNDKARPVIDFEALFIPDGARAVGFVVPALIADDVLLSHNKFAVEAYKKATGNDKVRTVQLLGASTWNDPDIATRLGREVDGAVFVDGFDGNARSALVAKFVDGFARVLHSRPALVEAQVYDGARLVGALLEGQGPAGQTEKPKTRAALRQALDDVNGFVGVTGPITFDDAGDSQTPLHFFVIDHEKVEETDVKELIKDAG